MPKRKEPELSPKKQFKRFRDPARELGCADDEAAFDLTLKKVASAPPEPQFDD